MTKYMYAVKDGIENVLKNLDRDTSKLNERQLQYLIEKTKEGLKNINNYMKDYLP